jgi:glycerophosphoryl diester phosphodiesterase
LFFSSPYPLVFAHRGGCALGPENTLAAFDRGLAAGADGLELDVHLSSDGIVVVHHDETLDRTTNATGPLVARTAAELGALDAECRFSQAFASGTGPRTSGPAEAGPHDAGPHDARGTGIPTLRDVLRRYPRIPLIVEMKVDSEAMGLAVAAEVSAQGAEDRVCAAGYGLQSLRAARAVLPAMATSASHAEVRLALYRSWAGWPPRHPEYRGYQVPEHAGRIRVVSRRFLRHAHNAGLKVQVWTVDDAADMERLLSWGVDALISNRPDLAVRVRDRFVAARVGPRA